MGNDLYLLYIDRDRLDDVLFLQNLARSLGQSGRTAPPCMLIHGSGALAEQWLEGEGLVPEREEGLLKVHAPREAALVERAVRETNRRLVSLLTDAIVPAVGLIGADRRLLHLEEGGTVAAGRAAWVAELAQKGAVPVIAALVQPEHAGPGREVGAAGAAVALAGALRGLRVSVVFFTRDNRPGIRQAETLVEVLPYDRLSEKVLPEPAAVGLVVRAGVPVIATSPAGLLHERGLQGTRVVT